MHKEYSDYFVSIAPVISRVYSWNGLVFPKPHQFSLCNLQLFDVCSEQVPSSISMAAAVLMLAQEFDDVIQAVKVYGLVVRNCSCGVWSVPMILQCCILICSQCWFSQCFCFVQISIFKVVQILYWLSMEFWEAFLSKQPCEFLAFSLYLKTWPTLQSMTTRYDRDWLTRRTLDTILQLKRQSAKVFQ